MNKQNLTQFFTLLFLITTMPTFTMLRTSLIGVQQFCSKKNGYELLARNFYTKDNNVQTPPEEIEKIKKEILTLDRHVFFLKIDLLDKIITNTACEQKIAELEKTQELIKKTNSTE